MNRIKLTIEFDGAPFSGWQVQKRGSSVQEVLETAIERALGERVRVHAAGRTDAGVHALAMVAHFDTANAIPVDKIPNALGAHLPDEVAVTSAESVPPEFDARRDATLRWYRYQISLDRRQHPLGPRAWRLRGRLDLKRTRAALAHFRGEHDFQGFRSSQCSAKRTLLTMREARLVKVGDLVAIDFKCRSFLQRMVRMMVGAAIAAGQGRIEPGLVGEILRTGDRPHTIKSAPAEGLCLMQIAYSKEEEKAILAAHPAPPSF